MNTVCVIGNTLDYPEGGGHFWVYLNWALGLRALGCSVIWAETVEPTIAPSMVQQRVATLMKNLEPYGLASSVALHSSSGEPLPSAVLEKCRATFEVAADADLLLDFVCDTPDPIVRQFRRSALIDIDPGLLQTWISRGDVSVAPHDVYFTIGETVGHRDARFPDCGLTWQYTPPCVALDWWPSFGASADAPFTTVSHWDTDEWMEDGSEIYSNDKRSGFLPFLDLPRVTALPLELAICLGDDDDEPRDLRWRGWLVQNAHEVASTPWDYQRYIQNSRGEFSCVKPSCVRLQNAWISDRTLCYLASGKPAVVQHTGTSRFLPESAGLFRFRDMDEAARCLETAAADYERHCRLARALAEEYFDAKQVAARVLERALA